MSMGPQGPPMEGNKKKAEMQIIIDKQLEQMASLRGEPQPPPMGGAPSIMQPPPMGEMAGMPPMQQPPMGGMPPMPPQGPMGGMPPIV